MGLHALLEAYRKLVNLGLGKLFSLGFLIGFVATVAGARIAADPTTWPVTVLILRGLHWAGWQTDGAFAPIFNGLSVASNLAVAPWMLLLLSLAVYAVTLRCGVAILLFVVFRDLPPIWAVAAGAVQAVVVAAALRRLDRENPVLGSVLRNGGAVIGAAVAACWFFAQFLPVIPLVLTVLQHACKWLMAAC
ncbi:MAG: hypothetical protein C0518_01040 [Opitutus sp.]|nr:hypothetical protein [Opitutus sp.]